MDAPKFLCGCGCGQEVPANKKTETRSRFLRGHNRRLKASRYEPQPDEIPSGRCECGCGKTTPTATVTYVARRHFKGHPVPYLPGHSPKRFRRGEDSHKWRGGRHQGSKGYIYLYLPEHPSSDGHGYVAEHRWVMEQQIGRFLAKHEQVHHKNGKRDDNRPENLELWKLSQPSGVRASDYHCPGCRCHELTA